MVWFAFPYLHPLLITWSRFSHYTCIIPFLLAAPPSYAESVSGQTRRYDTVHFDKGMGMPQLSAIVKKTS